MTLKHKSAIALLFAAATLSAPASADTYSYAFSGSGVSGKVSLVYAPNPNTGSPLNSSPNTFDPVGSYIVTGATGTFNDANIGLATTITGVVPSNPSDPEPTNLMAPASFGFYTVTGGVPGPGGVAPGFSYDNLFYPGGSPATATDYTFHGGFLDIYGLVFTTADGKAVNFWSNGDFGGGPTYGAGVTDGIKVLDYAGNIAANTVPEPVTWAMMVVGIGFVGAAMRKSRQAAGVRYSFA